MIAGEVIKFILSNFFVVLLLVAIVAWILKLRRARIGRRPIDGAYILWGELLFYVYGLANIYAGIFHAYAGNMVAASIGWQNSPFQYELGWFEIGYGLTALMSLWRGYAFRLAMTLPYSIFLLAAAAQHISQMQHQHNYAPNNSGLILWLGDIAIPLIVLLLSWMARDE
ncbi:MAG: hypothetical protein JO322_04215 [Candidatus Eremiobacteraeota bacterium]|nr:hypothetical protein [Candidatus Eremiobacteraeota bacterium]